jgi:DNA polymerase III subunit chi
MTRIDFYFNASDKLDVMTKLLYKSVNAGYRVFVHMRDRHMLNRFSQHLWQSRPLSFLPHVLSDHPLAAQTPVVIGPDPVSISKYDIMINYEPLIPDFYTRFDRLLEVVSEDADDRELSREHFRFFKQMGCPVYSHDLKADK